MNMGWYKELRDKSKYINIDFHVFQMKTADIESVANRQSRRWYAGIPMDEDCNINARIVQRRRRHASISMDIFAILYVVTTQRRWYYVGIPMDEFRNMNVLISQLGTSCSFDSPGLARNEPTPGKHPQGDSTP